MFGVACTSAKQCIAVDSNARVVTFNPSHPSTATTKTLPGASELRDITCPTATMCVTVDSVGHGFVGRGPAPKARRAR